MAQHASQQTESSLTPTGLPEQPPERRDRQDRDGWLETLGRLLGSRRRRRWSRVAPTQGRTHIELRPVDHATFPSYAAALVEQLGRTGGVRWVEVTPHLNRVIVDFDPTVTSPERLTRAVEEIERSLELADHAIPDRRPEHPGDVEPFVRYAIELGSDVFGIGLGAAVWLTNRRPRRTEIDLAGLQTVLQHFPHLRRRLARRLGSTHTDLLLGVSGAITNSLISGPISSMLSFGYHLAQLSEVRARYQVWERREPSLVGVRAHRAPLKRTDVGRRPFPPPASLLDRYSDYAWLVSLGGFAVGIADTRRLERAMAPLLDAVPKPARYGVEGFATQLDRGLARRDILVIDPGVLRHLDRIDCVVISAELLFGDERELGQIEAIGRADPGRVWEKASTLFDPADPTAIRRDRDWRLGPLEGLEIDPDEDLAARIKALGGARAVLVLARRNRPVALIQLRPVLDPAGEALVASIRKAGLRLVLATRQREWVGALEVDQVVPNGALLRRSVRELQRDGRVVALVTAHQTSALRAADCGIGLHRPGHYPPWAAHILAGERLEGVIYLIEALGAAKEVARQSLELTAAGAGFGAFMTLQGLEERSSFRVMQSVNIASALALANGVRVAAALDRRPRPVLRDRTPWHALSPEQTLEKLGGSSAGLNETQVAGRREDVPETAPHPGLWRSILREANNPLTPLLAGGGLISAAVGSLGDAAFVGASIALNALIGGVERFQAEQAIAALEHTGSRQVRIRREGREEVVDSGSLVEGDLVLLKAGEVVPADCRLMEALGLEVDESNLTGESLPVAKAVAATHAAVLAERRSMVYAGTSIAAGEATGVVVAVGDRTEAWRALVGLRESPPETGAEARLRELTELTLPVALGSGGLLLGTGLLRGRSLTDLAAIAVSLAVGAVPEGLPLLSTAAQLAAARRLSTRGALVRNPRAMEALGRVDIVCADKTGTLTEGKLHLHIVSDGALGEHVDELTLSHRAIVAAGLRASPEAIEGGELVHATDQAFVTGANHTEVAPEEGLEYWRRLHELPFKSERGYHAVLGETSSGLLISVKGAPEVVLPACEGWIMAGARHPLSDSSRRKLSDEAVRLAEGGLRILAVAQRTADDAGALDESCIDRLDFLGFVALSDPIRSSARPALRKLRQAGARVIMITGDHPSTALRIADELELADGAREVLTGPEIEALDEKALGEKLARTAVIARATPAHKVRIVRALRGAGHVVAMTGDGSNDAAAIRLADVGIALGSRATSAARQAADLIVMDDRIETIVDAVVEGRAMWTSVRDAVSILLGGNLGEIGYTLLGGLATGESPMNARQILFLNLVTDIAPALAVALHPPPETSPEELLRGGPRAALGQALTREIGWRALMTASSGSSAWLFCRLSGDRKRAPTVGLLALVGSQLGQTLLAGGRDRTVIAAALGSAAALLAVVETPGVSQAFGCQPVGPIGLATAATASTVTAALSLTGPRVTAGATRALASLRHDLAPRLKRAVDPWLEKWIRVYPATG